MEHSISEVLDTLFSFGGTLFSVIIIVVTYQAVRWTFRKRLKREGKGKLTIQLILSLVLLFGLFFVALSLPIGESLKGQIISLLGIVLSATFALSSTTLLGNALAGIMNRIVGHFRVGDFIRVQEFFGRVTNIGLFAVEIQVEDRSLVTLPNLYVVTNPVKGIRTSGYVVSSEVSLGYDVPRDKISDALKQAALDIGLTDPYVYVMSLGDFSVVYKVHGMLQEPEKLLTFKSKLNVAVLDALHAVKIEIVSPTFMNQRQVGDQTFIPKKVTKVEEEEVLPEEMVFDKAIDAESKEKRDEILNKLTTIREELEASLKKASDEEVIERQKARIAKIEEKIKEFGA